jgi:large subunit ribosomal protein L25
VVREVEVECLPDDIPEQFTFDVSGLMLGQSLRVSDVPLSGSMKLLSAADGMIAHVVSLKAEVVPETAEVAPGAPEPEIAKKGKKEEAPAEPAKKK